MPNHMPLRIIAVALSVLSCAAAFAPALADDVITPQPLTGVIASPQSQVPANPSDTAPDAPSAANGNTAPSAPYSTTSSGPVIVPSPAAVNPVCAKQNVTVCDIPVSVPGGTQAGGAITVNIAVPESKNATAAPQSFAVQCVYDGAHAPSYQVVNPSSLSCNDFPCQDTKTQLCGRTVSIPGGTAMGDVLRMNMPKPFAPDPFTVQCIGGGGKAPAYQIVDNSVVTCALAKGAQ